VKCQTEPQHLALWCIEHMKYEKEDYLKEDGSLSIEDKSFPPIFPFCLLFLVSYF